MLVERLAGLGVSDAVPAWDQLTVGEGDVLAQVRDLPPETLPVLTEVLTDSWERIPDYERAQACRAIAARVGDVSNPLSFASMLDRLTPAIAALDASAAEDLQGRLLDTVREHAGESGEARARFALGAAVDLVCAGATSPYALMAALDELRRDLPTDLAGPAARAAGRLAEQAPDQLYRTLLERALEIPEAEGDACVELGHACLRDAAAAQVVDDTMAALDEARRFYREAVAADETRPDASAFAAATELTLAFAAGADADALAPSLKEMEQAARELTLYDDPDAPSRTMHHVAAWLTLGARLRGAAEILDGRGVLDLEHALLSLLDVYIDSRLRVLGLQTSGLEMVIAPRIEQWVAGNPVSRAALIELCRRVPAGQELREHLEHLLAVTVEPSGKGRRSRYRPGSPGCFGLGDLKPTTPRRPPPPSS